MKNKISILYKAFRSVKIRLLKNSFIYTACAKLLLFLNGAEFHSSLKVNGFIKVRLTRRGVVKIGKNVKINSGPNYNIIGRQQKTIIKADGIISIGDNTGLSATALICRKEIAIGENVKIGGNTVIYDTDFHSLDYQIRNDRSKDRISARNKKVKIGNNVFIGSHSTILKGVSIGDNAIIGACSLVSKDIPSNEIWGGNPIKFLRKNN